MFNSLLNASSKLLQGKPISHANKSIRAIIKEAMPTTVCLGISAWKQKFLIKTHPEQNWIFLHKESKISEIHDTIERLACVRILVWGYNESVSCTQYAKDNLIPIVRVEDGFIRSIGLGSNKTPAMSLVFDDTGHLYFDPRAASRLELLIGKTRLLPNEVETAQTILSDMITNNLSKYNYQPSIISDDYYRPMCKPYEKRILVIGQVEDDASVRLGGCGYNNLLLVKKARELNPTSNIFFKPHPDVVEGNRERITPLEEIEKFAHVIDIEMSVDSALDTIDEVYVISSLVGFEALVRGKRVITVGQPFYNGWGLTTDLNPVNRRSEYDLSDLDEFEKLIHIFGCAYIKYPNYYNPTNYRDSDITEVMGWLSNNDN